MYFQVWDVEFDEELDQEEKEYITRYDTVWEANNEEEAVKMIEEYIGLTVSSISADSW